MTNGPEEPGQAPPRGLTNKQIKQSLKYSTLEGTAAAGMVGFSEQYVTPFALAAGASQTQIGILNSLPNFLTLFATLKAQNITEKIGSRKKTIMLLVFMDVFSVFPLLFVPIFVGKNFLAWFLLLSFYYFFPPIMINPIWGNLMADIVPAKRMGRYFSRRSALVGLSTLGCSLTAALILNHFGDASLTGFTIIFGVAVLFRIVSLLSYIKICEPPTHRVEDQTFGFIDFIKESKSNSLVKFILFICLMNFTLNLAGPFHAVYLIDTLNLSYPLYMVIINASAVATMVTLAFWGRRADAKGNVRVIKTSAFIMPIAPVLWLISANPVFLVAAQLLAGFAWAGFNLCGPNYIYEASPKEKRGKYLAYFSAVNIGALSLGAFAGGMLSNWLPPLKGSSLLTLFLLTGAMRLVIAMLFVPHLKESRFEREANQPRLFYNTLSVSPQLRGVFHNPLAYKPIVAAAETYGSKSTSRYSLFYNRFVSLVANTAAQPSDGYSPPPRDLYHNKEAQHRLAGRYAPEGSREVSRWTLFKRSLAGKRNIQKPSPIVGDDETIAEAAQRHLALLRKRAQQPRSAGSAPEPKPMSLYYNQEMKKQMRRDQAGGAGLETSPFALFRKRPPVARKRLNDPEEEEKPNTRGLFYRDVKAEDLMKKKKNKYK